MVVMTEIHMGVTVSPAPRIAPERVCVMDMAMYPSASMRICRAPIATNSAVSVNRCIKLGPKQRIHTTSVIETASASLMHALVPSRTRSIRPAPMFCPTYDVMALPKVKQGMTAKPSTRMTTVLHAMKKLPNVLVRFCTRIAAVEKMACDAPEGRPSRTSCDTYCFSGRSILRLTSTVSRIKATRTMHKTADTSCAMTVAHATPTTPQLNTATKRRSSTMLMPQAMIRKTRGITESPMPRSTPERML